MKKTSDALTYVWCLIVIEIFAAINAYVVNLKGATVDAERFIDNAIVWTKVGKLEFVTNAEFYIQMLGTIFLVTGPSEFLATQFGIAAMAVAGLYFLRLGKEFGVDVPPWAVVAFFLWPSMLLRTTTTLREPYLVLFFVMICYYVVAYKNHERTSDIVKLFATCAVAFLFHKAFAIFFVFGLGYILFFVLRQETVWYRSKVVLVRLALAALTVAGLSYIMLFASEVKGLKPLVALLTADSEYIGRIVDYKTSREFRTTYDAGIDLSSPLAFAISTPKALVYYMFAPFPWQISTPLDLFAALEGWFRAGALALFVRHWIIRKSYAPAMVPMIMLVLVLCLIWAAGTSNYGTASRHHLTTNWAFLLVYVVWLANWTKASADERLTIAGRVRPTS